MKAIIIIALFLAGCVASKDPQRTRMRNLQKGRVHEDTSFVYALPYQEGTAPRLVQGYFSHLSHRNRAALDFKMKRGTPVLAAREGVVVRAVAAHNRGGWHRKYRPYANYVVIEHADGSRAGYWHLQQNGVRVQVGEQVQQGQLIGLSGQTGYSAFPHLHFFVWRTGNGQWQQLPTRFQTKKGPRYLRPLRRYRQP